MPSKHITRTGAHPHLAMKAPVATIANLNITLVGHQVVDLVQTVDNMRVMVAGQTDATQNGIWIATSKDWVRAPDWIRDTDIIRGTMIINTNRSSGWIIEFTDADFIIDASEVSFIHMFGTVSVAGGGANEFDPGYDVTFVSTTSFTVDGFDLSADYHVGRRIKLVDQFGVFTFGIVATSVFVTDTTVTLTMEGTDTVPNPLTRAIFTSSTVHWTPVNPNNHQLRTTLYARLISGRIGTASWWVIYGLDGFISTSRDLGATWQQRTITGGLPAGSKINDMAYDPDNQRFMAVSDLGWFITSIDGINWVAQISADIIAQISTGNGDIDAIGYGWTLLRSAPGFVVFANAANPTASNIFTTVDFGVNWNPQGAVFVNPQSFEGIKFLHFSDPPDPDAKFFFNEGSSIYSVFPSGVWGAKIFERNMSVVVHDLTFMLTPDVGIAVLDNGKIFVGSQFGAGFYFERSVGLFGSTPILCAAYSARQDRVVIAGNEGKMAFSDDGVTFLLFTNGFNTGAGIIDIWYDEDDGIWIAISDDGMICRSTTGIS